MSVFFAAAVHTSLVLAGNLGEGGGAPAPELPVRRSDGRGCQREQRRRFSFHRPSTNLCRRAHVGRCSAARRVAQRVARRRERLNIDNPIIKSNITERCKFEIMHCEIDFSTGCWRQQIIVFSALNDYEVRGASDGATWRRHVDEVTEGGSSCSCDIYNMVWLAGRRGQCPVFSSVQFFPCASLWMIVFPWGVISI